MSSIARKRRAELKDRASVFAALGDETRLSLIGKLSNGPPQSISRLAKGSTLTRQAITKHLRVLEGAGVVHSVRVGRENLFEFRLEPLEELRSYLERVSDQWEDALAKGFRRYHIANLILARAKQAECGAQKSRPWCEV